MKIGITGGTGFIGTYLIDEWAGKHDMVVATSKVVPNREAIEYKQVDYSQESFRAAFEGCDAVVHLGGKIQHDKNKTPQTMRAYVENIFSTENVFAACHELGISNVVFSSSTTVYPKKPDVVYDEKMPTEPLNLYGISKVACENLACFYNNLNDMHIKSLRLAYVFGVNSTPEGKSQLVSVYLQNAAEGKPLLVYGKGISANTYIYVKDVVAAIDCAVFKPELSGVFNIGNSEPTSNLQLAELFSEVFDCGSTIKILPDLPEHGLSWRIATKEAKEQLGFSPEYSVSDAINNMKELYNKLDV